MRTLFALIVLAAIAFLAWTFRVPLTAASQRLLPPPADESNEPSTIAEPTLPLPASTAAPGVYYALERVTNETPNGIAALNPGAQVRLMYRFKDGRMQVTDGRNEFIVKPSALSKSRQPSALPPAP